MYKRICVVFATPEGKSLFLIVPVPRSWGPVFLYIFVKVSFLGHPRPFLIADLIEGESKSKNEPSGDAGS